jgi:hypothetical protein
VIQDPVAANAEDDSGFLALEEDLAAANADAFRGFSRERDPRERIAFLR